MLHPGQRVDRVLKEAPLIVIEIMSPEDRLSRLQERLQDYANTGVEYIWIIDPQIRAAYRYVDGMFADLTATIEIPNSETLIEISDIWAAITN